MSKVINAEILTPYGTTFRGPVSAVKLPGTNGSFQVLYNHAPLMSTLDTGIIVIKSVTGSEETFSISGGFVEVHNNQVTVLAEAAEAKDKIDLARAIEAKKRSEELLSSKDSSIDFARAEFALKRAINRIKQAKS